MISVLLVVIVILVGGYLIYQILDEKKLNVDDETTTTTLVETEVGLDIKEEHDGFKSFVINKEDLDNLSVQINKGILKVSDKKIYVDDQELVNDVTINRSLALYSERLLVIGFNYNNLLYSGIIIYDLYEGTYEIINKIDNKFIDDYSFTSTGMLLSTKLVSDNLYILSDGSNDICEYKDNVELEVLASLMFLYDINEKKFSEYEILGSVTLGSYLNSNNLCGR